MTPFCIFFLLPHFFSHPPVPFLPPPSLSSPLSPILQGTRLPGPLPLGVAVIDASIVLFGRAFPNVAQKHRQQLLSHFRECIRQAKGARQQAIQINIFTSFLAALKVVLRCITCCSHG